MKKIDIGVRNVLVHPNGLDIRVRLHLSQEGNSAWSWMETCAEPYRVCCKLMHAQRHLPGVRKVFCAHLICSTKTRGVVQPQNGNHFHRLKRNQRSINTHVHKSTDDRAHFTFPVPGSLLEQIVAINHQSLRNLRTVRRKLTQSIGNTQKGSTPTDK